MQIKWKELLLVSSVSIAVAILVSGLFALGVRLLTNAQHAVPGSRKGKAEDIRKEILNRVFAYLAFAGAAVILAGFLYLIVNSADKTLNCSVHTFFGLECK